MSINEEEEKELTEIAGDVERVVGKLMEFEKRGRQLAYKSEYDTVNEICKWLDDYINFDLSEFSTFINYHYPELERLHIPAHELSSISLNIKDVGEEISNLIHNLKECRKILDEIGKNKKFLKIRELRELVESLGKFIYKYFPSLELPRAINLNVDGDELYRLSNKIYSLYISLEDALIATPKVLMRKYNLTEDEISELLSLLNSLYDSWRRAKESLMGYRCSLRIMDSVCMSTFNTPCTWLFSNLKEKDRYTLSALTNDLSSAIHRVAESLRKFEIFYKKTKKVGRFRVTEEVPDPLLKMAERLNELWKKYKNLYEEHDEEPLGGFCYDKKCEITVGSSPGHRTHIQLINNNVVLEYYDTDDNVNRVMKSLWENYSKCNCEILYYSAGEGSEGVRCICPADSIDKIADVLVFATSMDYRLREPEKYYNPSDIKECKENLDEIKKVSGLKNDDEALEYCLVLKMLEKR